MLKSAKARGHERELPPVIGREEQCVRHTRQRRPWTITMRGEQGNVNELG